MLSCKEATTAMAQELKQAVYVKPNLTAENGKPFQGDLESIYTVYRLSLIHISEPTRPY